MKSYAEDLPILVALISHLGACKLKAKSVSYLNEKHGFDSVEIKRVFEEYPELFIASGYSSKYANEKTFTLQLRYALRWTDKDHEGNEDRKPLDPGHISTLLTFVDNQAANENAAKQQKKANYYAVGSAAIAAIAAVIAALFSSGALN